MAEPDLLVAVDDVALPATTERGYRAGDFDRQRGFKDILREPQEFIGERQRLYLSPVEGRGLLLDVHCGRAISSICWPGRHPRRGCRSCPCHG
jgi:hypothetical protein